MSARFATRLVVFGMPSDGRGREGYTRAESDRARPVSEGTKEPRVSSVSGENCVAAEQFSADYGETPRLVIRRTYHT